MPDHQLLNGLFSHGGREKYPPAALNWVLAVPNLIHTYIHTCRRWPYSAVSTSSRHLELCEVGIE